MKISKFPNKITEELAEETGWHIGDGSMNYYKKDKKMKGFYQLRGHIEDDKRHYLERIKPVFKSLYGIDISLREMPSTRVFGFQIWNDELVRFKQELGLPLGRKIELEVPKEFFFKKECLLACIRGIFDTDGCVYLEKKNHKLYPRMQIVTISNNLAKQLQEIFNGLNFRCSLNSFQADGNRLRAYQVVIRGVEMFHKFMRLVSPRNPKHLAKYNLFKQSFK